MENVCLSETWKLLFDLKDELRLLDFYDVAYYWLDYANIRYNKNINYDDENYKLLIKGYEEKRQEMINELKKTKYSELNPQQKWIYNNILYYLYPKL